MRPLRAGEQIRHALADMFGRTDWRDQDLAGRLITVTEARVSGDLSSATVFVMPLLGRDTDKVVEALNRNKSFIKRETAAMLKMRVMPDLRFVADTSFENSEKVERLLKGGGHG